MGAKTWSSQSATHWPISCWILRDISVSQGPGAGKTGKCFANKGSDHLPNIPYQISLTNNDTGVPGPFLIHSHSSTGKKLHNTQVAVDTLDLDVQCTLYERR